MAIEKYGSADDTGMDQMGPEDSAEGGETTEIPIAMIREGQPGDVVRLEIVSRNDDSGTATVRYSDRKPDKESAIDAAANNPKYEA